MAALLIIRPFEGQDEESAVAIWRACGLLVPWNDPHRDIQRKLQVQTELFLVGCLGEQPFATVMVGCDGHRGWINYLAVEPSKQGRGFGRQMMDAAEEHLRRAGCPKINLQVCTGNQAVIAFYQGLGFALDDCVSLGKRLETDRLG